MSLRRNALGLIAAIAAAALLPASALGSTASISGGDTLSFSAAVGETNNLTVAQAGASYVLTDPGAPITPSTGCAAVNANQVTCSTAGVFDIDISLGDLNDNATIAASLAASDNLRGNLDGGAGADTLTNSSTRRASRCSADDQADLLTGGPACDRLIGGDDNDVSIGNGGRDRFDEGLGTDVSSGGAGEDDFNHATLRRRARQLQRRRRESTTSPTRAARRPCRSRSTTSPTTGRAARGRGARTTTSAPTSRTSSGGARGDVLVGSASANQIDRGRWRTM